MMADESTPQPTPHHDVPSLPASPEPKRTKFTEPAPNLTVASILNDAAPTPTPETAPTHNPLAQVMASHPPPPPPHATLPSMPAMPPMPMSTEAPPPPLQVKLLSSTAKPPTRSSAYAAGYDIYASRATSIPAWGKALVETDISIAVPANTYGRVAPRSGLASKHGIDVGAGVIDADYRGPVKVLLFNLSGTDFSVNAGDRVAQLIVERIYTPDVVVVEQLEETVRGAGGFGSTGGFGGVLPGLNGVTGGAAPTQP